jgi:O-acetyl-ADP-ribose deacetylase (regulator of RNase III)
VPGEVSGDRGLVRTIGPGRLEIERGDLTRETVDAIVNAANSSLLGGGGVDGAIHRAGGPRHPGRVPRHPRAARPPAAGRSGDHDGGALPARHVIHTVGPVWQGGHAGEARRWPRATGAASPSRMTRASSPSPSPASPPASSAIRSRRPPPVALRAIAEALPGARHVRLVRCVVFSEGDLAAYARALAALSAGPV